MILQHKSPIFALWALKHLFSVIKYLLTP